VGYAEGRYVTNCYFLDSAGPDNGRGNSLSDAAMKQQASFVGWDFNAEIINGTDDVWHMPNGTAGYPMLFFQRDIPADTTGKYGVDIEDLSSLSASWVNSPANLEILRALAQNWLEGK